MIANVTHSGLTTGEVDYARLLFLSGFGVLRIADVMGHDRRVVEKLAEYHGWRRQTPCRFSAPIGWHRPVLVRCQACSARYGEEFGKPRPCPHCGFSDRDGLTFTDPDQLSLLEDTP
jgi:hypothetical protein